MKKLSTKLVIAVAITTVVLMVLTSGLSLFFLSQLSKNNGVAIDKMLMDKYDEEIKWQTEQANSMLTAIGNLRDTGKLGKDEAVSLAQTLLNSLRYGKDGYFWADTVEGINMAHGSKPENMGRNRMNDVDAKGFKLIEAIIKAGVSGGGYTTYYYPRMGSDVPEPKRGYSLLNPSFGWVLGTGNYFDDIHKAVLAQQKINAHHAQGVTILMLIVSLIILFLVIFVVIVLSRYITRPIQKVTEALQEIACGSADLTKKLPVLGQDEIGQLSLHFNEFLGTLNKTMSQALGASDNVLRVGEKLKENANQLRTSTEEIHRSIDEMHGMLENQTGSISGTSSAVEQIVRNIESLTERIELQATNVTESSASIEEMVGNIRSVSNNLTTASQQFSLLVDAARVGREKLDRVSQSSQAAQTFSDHLIEANSIIQSIASQTNLLAMNAAIEAAHAGDAGRGFTVVAEEIRKLAENASEQSKEIAVNLKQIKDTIDLVVDTSVDAGSAFGNIESLVHRVENLVSEIQHAMQEQNEGNQQVLESLTQMQQITMEVRDGSKEMRSGATLILNETNRLNESGQSLIQKLDTVTGNTDAIVHFAQDIEAVAAQNIGESQNLAAIVGQFTCEDV